jgi:AAA+ ATPase superfamily predicted ATPase
MPNFKYDQIIVTGCSFSCGMEMNDHLLPSFANLKERQMHIWKWAKSSLKVKFESIKDLQNTAKEHWEEKERDSSWPAFLQTKTGIPVVNLANIGSSIGRTLIEYSNFIGQRTAIKKKILVIHQLPYFPRMYMRFNRTHGRINVLPSNDGRINVLPSDVDSGNNFGFDKSFFKDDIFNTHRLYRHRILKVGYLQRYTGKIVSRLEKISSDNGIKNYYITPDNSSSIALPSQKIILNDFESFRSHYPKGVLGHPIGNNFNVDLCDKIISTCF